LAGTDAEDWLDCCPGFANPRADAASIAQTAITQIAGKKRARRSLTASVFSRADITRSPRN
jgi:hypothetical protein